MNKACHHDRLFNWKLFKHVDILANAKKNPPLKDDGSGPNVFTTE